MRGRPNTVIHAISQHYGISLRQLRRYGVSAFMAGTELARKVIVNDMKREAAFDRRPKAA
jgi:hypothetical protein